MLCWFQITSLAAVTPGRLGRLIDLNRESAGDLPAETTPDFSGLFSSGLILVGRSSPAAAFAAAFVLGAGLLSGERLGDRSAPPSDIAIEANNTPATRPAPAGASHTGSLLAGLRGVSVRSVGGCAALDGLASRRGCGAGGCGTLRCSALTGAGGKGAETGCFAFSSASYCDFFAGLSKHSLAAANSFSNC